MFFFLIEMYSNKNLWETGNKNTPLGRVAIVSMAVTLGRDQRV